MVLSWDCQPTWSAFIYSPPPPSRLSLFRTHCKYFSDKPPWPATPLFESPYLSVKNQSVGIEKSRYPDGNHSLVWNDQVCPILRWNVFFETCQTVSFRKMCCGTDSPRPKGFGYLLNKRGASSQHCKFGQFIFNRFSRWVDGFPYPPLNVS